ncbi:MAG: chorismate mutase [Candidatus Krumholzibacteriia bacterium]
MSIITTVRGAIVAEENTSEAILAATRDLLDALIESNGLTEDNIAAMFFTSTVDLTAEFPALALRKMNWWDVPALCAQELEIDNSMERVIRAMVLVNRPEQFTPKHEYIGKAAELRPDRTGD